MQQGTDSCHVPAVSVILLDTLTDTNNKTVSDSVGLEVPQKGRDFLKPQMQHYRSPSLHMETSTNP